MSQRDTNRERMPNVASLMDELGLDQFKEIFGAKVIAAEDLETGVKMGKFGDEDE